MTAVCSHTDRFQGYWVAEVGAMACRACYDAYAPTRINAALEVLWRHERWPVDDEAAGYAPIDEVRAALCPRAPSVADGDES